jgi:glyoxylase-like metal-dependent hydrolase (beta-lactamase superfamily II)/ferredoxin
MADVTKRLSTNVDGNFFVDATCINCDTCRQLAPKSFAENGDYSSVYCQPETESERYQAYQALLACPVGSIGALVPDKAAMRAATESFPMLIQREGARPTGKEPVLAGLGWVGETTPGAGGCEREGARLGAPGAGGCESDVYYNGFNSEKSFGANSYFIRHPDGNWLVDAPRYMKRLVDAFERMGGIAYIFLTHEDDIGDTPRYAKHFRAKRVIHRADADAQPDAEWIIDGLDPVEALPDFRIIPVPGHTDGSMALLYRNRYLFTGDHMAWDREITGLRLATVYVWKESALRRSATALLEYPFEWILPGHGDRMYLPADRMREELRLLLARREARASISAT